MRYLYALIVSTGLCVVPSLSLAATGAETASVSAVSASKPARADERNGADVKASRAADVAGDQARYAEREAKSGEAQDYRGGDTVVIGASAATAILAVLLLIVLI